MATNKTSTIIFKGEDQISPAIKGATASVAGLSQSFAGVEESATKTGNSIREKLVKELELARAKLSEIARQPKTAEVRVEQGKALAEVNRLARELKKLDQPIVISPKVQIDPLQLNAISQSFSAISSKLTELKGAASAAFGEISAAERKLSTVSGESKQLIKNFGELAAATKFQVTTAELAGASYEVLSAGFTKTADVNKILEASTKGAVGGFSDVTTVSKATVSALNAYGKGADDAASFVSKFVSVQQSGLITVDQYAQQLPRIAPTASLAKLSIDELNGAIATATASGVPVEATFSGLRTALGAILKPTSEAASFAKDVGVQFNATALKTKGLSGVLKELKATGNDSAEALLNLFGSQEAVAAIAPLISDIGKLDQAIEASKNSAALLGQNFDKAIDPIKAFQNETTEALAILGRDIAKVFNPVINGTKAVVAAFRGLNAPLQEIIAFFVGTGAAIATTGASIAALAAVATPTLAGLKLLASGFAASLAFLTAGQVALGTATATTTGLTAAEAAAFGGVATSSGAAATGVGGLTTATAGLGTAAGVTAGTLGLIALAAAPLVIIGKQFNDAWGTSEVIKGLEDFDRKLADLEARRGKLLEPPKVNTDDGLGSQSINEGNILTGFINPFNTRQSEQRAVIQFAEKENQERLKKAYVDSVAVLKEYGLANDESAKKTKLNADQLESFTKKIQEKKENLDLLINSLQQEGEKAKGNPVLQAQIRNEIIFLSNKKKLLEDRVKQQTETDKKVIQSEKRSSEAIEEIAKKRIETEKRTSEDQAKIRSRKFEDQTRAESKAFETQSRTEKQAFEKSLNDDKKKFEAGQKADKDKFEKDLQSQQRTFNEAEKAKDQSYQRSKQDLERAFTAQQQAAKEAFDKQQQAASKAFDDKQNEEKKTADTQFAQRRLEIERKLQLDAAKSPEDRAKLEAEFKIADEKAAREKEAFAQLKAEEEAFAKKQQADKQAFDDAQKVANQAFEKQQQAEKIAFDDVLKLKDQEYEKQKEIAKLAFEDALKVKRDALEATQNTAKLAFEDAQNLKKTAFEDVERTKKDAFETVQRDKKSAFEDAERIKKQAFEDNLKLLEAQFKADERAKDLANAQQVAAIKNGGASAVLGGAALGIGASPRAKGGRFDSGQQLLVGEQGAELVTFGSSGYVSNATDSKQILQANNSAPSSVSTARMEALLGQLVGKLDRPNIAVQTSENPSDVLIKIQRETARSAAISSGI